MNQNEWIYEMQSLDGQRPLEDLDSPSVYTVFRQEFSDMPTLVDFQDLIKTDVFLRALLN